VGTRAYVVDPLNSVRAVIDGVGTSVNSYGYFAYGEALHVQGLEENRFRFTGRDWDEHLNVYFERNRYYSPETGRWLSQDPIGFLGGSNMYVYIGNNPTSYTDPLGLCACIPLGDPLSMVVGCEDPVRFKGGKGEINTIVCSTGFPSNPYFPQIGQKRVWIGEAIQKCQIKKTQFGVSLCPSDACSTRHSGQPCEVSSEYYETDILVEAIVDLGECRPVDIYIPEQ